ncbi:MAG: PAS domain S-box protein, partial [Chloroflexi bacterium]|nr:PAS domain S-box protein [Chloroflexota bacterium]
MSGDRHHEKSIRPSRTEEALRAALEKRRELETIINRSPAVVFLWRAAEGWPVEFVSDNVAQFGYSPDDFTSGRIPYADIVYAEDRARVADEVNRYSREGRAEFTQEYRILTRSGEVRWLDDRTFVRRDPTGTITHYQGLVIDITERKRAEDQLRRLSRAVEQCSDTIVITDTAGNIEYVNPKGIQLTGYMPEEIIGKNPRIFKSGKTPPALYKQLWDTITSGGEWRGELINRKKNGELYWEATSISPIRDPKGVITHFVAVKEDITERKRAEEERERLLARVEQHR